MQSWKLGGMPVFHRETEQDGPIKENEAVVEHKY